MLCQMAFLAAQWKTRAKLPRQKGPERGAFSLKITLFNHPSFRYSLSVSGCPPVNGQFAMAIPDLDALTSESRTTADKIFPGSLRRCLPGLLLFSFCIFGSPIGYGQDQQTSSQQQDPNQQTRAQDQDVAKAAREERARKQANPSKPRHVYTAEDLKRDQILTPEDRAMFEASRKQWTPLIPAPSQDALDAQSLPPDAPLGDIARSLQRQKELMQLRRSNEFHLTLPEAPVFAAPKLSMEPLRSPLVIIEPPARPAVVGPFHPPVKRSPFERPRILPPALAGPHTFPPVPVTPSTPEKPRAFAATTPSAPRVSPNRQTFAPAPEMPHAATSAPIGPQVSPSAPKAPRNLNPSKPIRPAVRMPGAAFAPEIPHATAPALVAPQVAPAAPKAPRNLAPAKPGRPALKAPRAMAAQPPVFGLVPATPAVPVMPPVAPAKVGIEDRGKVITVLPGDSLWKIAEQHLGNGLRWQELLAVNPGISDPSRILAGSQLVLPAPVSAQRTTKYTVQKGDSLWSIAQAHLGRATAWSCVAKANPDITDANFIREGQVITVPASCKP